MKTSHLIIPAVLLMALALTSCFDALREVDKEVPATAGGVDRQTAPGPETGGDRPWRDWSGLSDEELRKKLTREQYYVTREDGTERAFTNKYDGNKEEGLYVCIISGDPLFSSRHKFDSGTGWPSFYRPLIADNIAEVVDRSHGMVRTEVRARRADSHLGHVFDDGPRPTGLRYCMNSSAMRFVPVAKLEEEGYGDYLRYFRDQ